MSEFKVESDHLLPAVSPARGRREKYPWSRMEVGDSFFIEDGKPERLKSAAAKAQKRLGRGFTARRVDGGVRIWRYE